MQETAPAMQSESCWWKYALPKTKNEMNCVPGAAPNPTIVENKDRIVKKPVKSRRTVRNAKPSCYIGCLLQFGTK